MTLITEQELNVMVSDYEGRECYAYRDSRGILTIGVGFNLEKPGAALRIGQLGVRYDLLCRGKISLTESEIDELLGEGLRNAIANAQALFPEFATYPKEKQLVIADMIFNLGLGGFKKFKNLIRAIKSRKWSLAADEMMYADGLTKTRLSDYYQQTKRRSKENVRLMRL